MQPKFTAKLELQSLCQKERPDGFPGIMHAVKTESCVFDLDYTMMKRL